MGRTSSRPARGAFPPGGPWVTLRLLSRREGAADQAAFAGLTLSVAVELQRTMIRDPQNRSARAAPGERAPSLEWAMPSPGVAEPPGHPPHRRSSLLLIRPHDRPRRSALRAEASTGPRGQAGMGEPGSPGRVARRCGPSSRRGTAQVTGTGRAPRSLAHTAHSQEGLSSRGGLAFRPAPQPSPCPPPGHAAASLLPRTPRKAFHALAHLHTSADVQVP